MMLRPTLQCGRVPADPMPLLVSEVVALHTLTVLLRCRLGCDGPCAAPPPRRLDSTGETRAHRQPCLSKFLLGNPNRQCGRKCPVCLKKREQLSSWEFVTLTLLTLIKVLQLDEPLSRPLLAPAPVTPNIECHSYHADPPPMLRRGYLRPVLLHCLLFSPSHLRPRTASAAIFVNSLVYVKRVPWANMQLDSSTTNTPGKAASCITAHSAQNHEPPGFSMEKKRPLGWAWRQTAQALLASELSVRTLSLRSPPCNPGRPHGCSRLRSGVGGACTPGI